MFFQKLIRKSRTISADLASTMALQRHQLVATLLAQEKYRDEKRLTRFGYKIFSQFDEDGIIEEIFRRIGTTNRTFIEFGVGDGLENNTLALLYKDWSGLWIEGSEKFSHAIQAGFSSAITKGQLCLVNSFITSDNIESLIESKYSSGSEIDLLSVDIDGNDAHIIRAINNISARVVVAEYNAKFGPCIDYCMKYRADHNWSASDHFGASLKHYEILMREKGYCLVGCNLSGLNAFFVRADLVESCFLIPADAETHFEPARYDLIGLRSGHPRSGPPTAYKTFSERH